MGQVFYNEQKIIVKDAAVEEVKQLDFEVYPANQQTFLKLRKLLELTVIEEEVATE